MVESRNPKATFFEIPSLGSCGAAFGGPFVVVFVVLATTSLSSGFACVVGCVFCCRAACNALCNFPAVVRCMFSCDEEVCCFAVSPLVFSCVNVVEVCFRDISLVV